jgi:hypothetical protein
MLIEMSGSRYRANVGEKIQIVAQSTGNGGNEGAEFKYNKTEPPGMPFDTSPGCEITVLPGNKQFQAIVNFNFGVSGAQYDLFQVDENGDLAPLDQFVTSEDTDPLIGFTITGGGAAGAMKVGKKVAKAGPAGAAVKKTAKKAAKKAGKAKKTKKTKKTAKAAKAAKAAKKTKKSAPKKTVAKKAKKVKKAKVEKSKKKTKAGQS